MSLRWHQHHGFAAIGIHLCRYRRRQKESHRSKHTTKEYIRLATKNIYDLTLIFFLDFALFLDPDEIGGSYVAIGVFNTPTVTYHSSNEVISFIYHFYSDGYHQLIVSLICMTDSSYVYLNSDYSHYKVSNFVLNSYDVSGIKCLDLHSYLGECESFQVQFTGGVVGSKLAVDDVYFYASDSFPCGKHCMVYARRNTRDALFYR